MKTKPIIFFDGVCGLCNGFVDFVMKIDRREKIFFSPLQSNTAKEMLAEEYTTNMSTIVFIHNEIIVTKSDAVIEVLKTVGGIWKLVTLFKIVPKLPRDLCYDLVSQNRYRLFGKKETCRIPSKKEFERFLL